jgi:hypothetical protein
MMHKKKKTGVAVLVSVVVATILEAAWYIQTRTVVNIASPVMEEQHIETKSIGKP